MLGPILGCIVIYLVIGFFCMLGFTEPGEEAVGMVLLWPIAVAVMAYRGMRKFLRRYGT